MATKVKRSEWKNPHGLLPPPPVSTRSGCKVGWNTYATLEDAEACSRWAQEQAKHMAEQGYDFGWQVPGSVRPCDGGWEVVIP
jgi:hypothetical protein